MLAVQAGLFVAACAEHRVDSLLACDAAQPCPQGEACDAERLVCITAPGSTGSACGRNEDCNAPLSCDTRVPGGYCSRDCTPCPAPCGEDSGMLCPAGCVPADEALCPDQGRCVTIALAGLEENRCLAPCLLGGEQACRADYRCKPVPGRELGLCLP